MPAQPGQYSPQQANDIAAQLIRVRGVEMTQQIYTATVVPAATPVLNIAPRNVGLIKGFWVEISATIANTDGANDLTLSDYNVANLLSNITFTDLAGNTRINCPGWFLELTNSLKSNRVAGSAAVLTTGFDSPIKYGSNWSVITAAGITHGTSGTVKMLFWVPLAYSDNDYRGAVFAGVTNATMNLSLTFNPTPLVASASDTTQAVMKGTTVAGSITSATVTVYQQYMDQIPVGQNGVPILPGLDLSTIYGLTVTNFTALTAGQDFPMQFANFRDFLNTTVVYYNGAARAAGTDINYFSLVSANFTNIFKMDPYLIAYETRQMLGVDPPLGTYVFPSRQKPIATNQYGNMQLVLNPITAGATAYALVGWEYFARVGVVNNAGSLAG